MNQIAALKALGVKRMVGVSYFPPALNEVFGRYFRDAGFDVLAMEGIDVPFRQVQELSSQMVYSFIKPLWKKHAREAEVIYMLGSGWRTLDIVETMEQDFEIPVLQSICAQVWEFERRLDVRHPLQGFGRLMREMPPLPA
jgi:maleate isomerase